MRRGRRLVATLVLVALGPLSGARAYAANPVEAAQLAFDEGRRLADAGDFASAAARFEESERLEPALGTILNLASCYERGARIASAWRAFRRGAEEATALGEAKRAARASEHAQALGERLSTIILRVDPGAPPDEEIRVDGAAVDRSAWATSLPVDGGEHTIVARAGSRKDWSGHLSVSNEAEHATMNVPALLPQPPASAVPPPASEATSVTLPSVPLAPEAKGSLGTWTPLRLGAVASAGVGLVAVGFGVGYGLQARDRWNDRQAQCAYDYCSDRGYTLTAQANDAATRSTIAFAIGGVGILAGTLLFALPRSKANVTLGGGAVPGGGNVRLTGVF